MLVASLANSLGGVVSYALGYFLPKRYTISDKAQRLFAKYGVWALLLSWLPVIGDLLPIGAGWLRLNVWLSVVMITLGKTVRYGVLTALVLQVV